MKVKALKVQRTDAGMVAIGDTVELSDGMANHYIAMGAAEPYQTKIIEPKLETKPAADKPKTRKAK